MRKCYTTKDPLLFSSLLLFSQMEPHFSQIEPHFTRTKHKRIRKLATLFLSQLPRLLHSPPTSRLLFSSTLVLVVLVRIPNLIEILEMETVHKTFPEKIPLS